MSEDERIIEFRYRQMTWKDWALIIAVNVIFYFVVSVIQSSG